MNHTRVFRFSTSGSGLILSLFACSVYAQPTWPYAVQLTASVQTSPASITLNWVTDPNATSYTVYRKFRDDTSWGSPLASLPDTAQAFTDSSVSAGVAYEYQVAKATAGYEGFGYIYTGIQVPPIENRGKLLLVAAGESTAGLDNELARLQSDLVGDGWQVLRFQVSSNDAPLSVRSTITNAYYADPTQVKAVFLFGHVPVLMSGNISYDTHPNRPMPADAFYGEMNNDWPVDPSSSPSFLPSDVQLMVGRVDFADMPGNGAPAPWPSEVELLRNYLNKDHQWRHKQISVQRRALVADRFEIAGGDAYAASGWRNFAPFVGPANTLQADVSDGALPSQRWVSLVAAGTYLWSYGCGGGQVTSISELGLHPDYNNVWSTDVVAQDAKAVFTMFFGSWFGAWNEPDDFLRAMLATPTMGLASAMVGAPHWFCHHMGLGEPIGYSTRLSMNNSTLYQNQNNPLTRAVYISLMGDPTLRLDPVAPAANLNANPTPSGVQLSWSASPDTVAGYYVYRAATPDGPFTRLTASPVTGTTFADMSGGTGTYMVRALKLDQYFSGSYSNLSQGIVAVSAASVPTIVLSASLKLDGLHLSWNTQPGSIYRLLATDNPPDGNWTVVQGPTTASSTTGSYVDPGVFFGGRRFYRVASP